MLRIEDLVKDFGKSRVINSASFEVKDDEIVALVGPNGAGKTTLVNLISGHILPTSGKIKFLGKDVTSASPYRRIKSGIARNFQITNLFEDSSVLDNVKICLFSVYGKLNKGFLPASHYRDITREAEELLNVFGIEDQKHEMPPNLSEGDKKVLDVTLECFHQFLVQCFYLGQARHYADHQVRLGGEIVVDGSLRDTSSPGNLFSSSTMKTLLCEYFGSSIENLIASRFDQLFAYRIHRSFIRIVMIIV